MASKKLNGRGSKSSQAQKALAATISNAADQRAVERSEAARSPVRLTTDEWDWVIERVRDGDTDANIARHFGLSKGAIAVKRREDPDFAARYFEALEDAFVAIASETQAVARGIEGYSSGDVQRDRLIVETDLKLASKFARKIMGDKPLLGNVESVTIVLRGDSDDVC